MMPPQCCQIIIHTYFHPMLFILGISFTTANDCVILTSIVHQYWCLRNFRTACLVGLHLDPGTPICRNVGGEEEERREHQNGLQNQGGLSAQH